jgi:2'-phosphotransferase
VEGTTTEEARIRAVQGHSIATIEDELLLTEITDLDELSSLQIIHGTYRRFLDSILENGLKRMSRNHIHCATGLPDTETSVTSGLRNSAQLAIFIDGVKCKELGMKVLMSQNGVVLINGLGDEGIIPAECFREIRCLDGQMLDER